MDKLDDSGMVVGIDFMVAIVLLISAVMMAIMIMPAVSHEDRDWRIKQYMTTTRATDILVQDTGEEGWEGNWTSNVTKIGFLYVDDITGVAMLKVLDLNKVMALMEPGYTDNTTGTTWWEFPNYSIPRNVRDNVASSLGLERYNFYMQLHPVGLNNFNSTPLDANLRAQKGISYDTVTVVDRYVYIMNPSSPDLIKYLKYDGKAIHYRLNMWVW